MQTRWLVVLDGRRLLRRLLRAGDVGNAGVRPFDPHGVLARIRGVYNGRRLLHDERSVRERQVLSAGPSPVRALWRGKRQNLGIVGVFDRAFDKAAHVARRVDEHLLGQLGPGLHV